MASKTLLPPLITSISRNSRLIHRFSRPIVLLGPDHTSHDFMHVKHTIKPWKIRWTLVRCCLGSEEESEDGGFSNHSDLCYGNEQQINRVDSQSTRNMKEVIKMQLLSKLAKKEEERYGYLVFALMSSLGISSMAIFAIYCRFSNRIMDGELPYLEILGTFALTMGACVGMEYWARWAHRVLWHGSLWVMHKSHHRHREGMFELNDVLAISNAFPAISLLSYGFCNHGLLPALCFATGLGMTVFGITYMFIHDGLVHRRFPVGPIADCPYLRRVAAAHQLHHSEKLKGVPYGLFLGPQEIEEVGGQSELEKEINRRSRNPSV